MIHCNMNVKFDKATLDPIQALRTYTAVKIWAPHS
jgi:hypothetical protein